MEGESRSIYIEIGTSGMALVCWFRVKVIQKVHAMVCNVMGLGVSFGLEGKYESNS